MTKPVDSVITIAISAVSVGTPDHATAGEMSSPWQV